MSMSSRKLAAYRSSGRVADLNYSKKDRDDLLDPDPDPTPPPSNGPNSGKP
jgi:hypothetical protein